MELVKYVYFCAQRSIIKAGNNKFQDLINVPRTYLIHIFFSYSFKQKTFSFENQNFDCILRGSKRIYAIAVTVKL